MTVEIKSPPRISTFIVTGFLGSGKTTLLRRILEDPAFCNTAVIVNEFGTVGLDHDLMAYAPERTIVMPGGCICCSIREDIETTLQDLLKRVDTGALPPIDRLVIETTGLADPVPLLFTLHSSPLAGTRLEVYSVIVTVDALLGTKTLDRQIESEKQIAAADQIVITKCDMALESDISVLIPALRRRNPWANIEQRNLLQGPPVDLFSRNRHALGLDIAGADLWVLGVHMPLKKGGARAAGGLQSRNPRAQPTYRIRRRQAHLHNIHSFCITYDKATDWTAFGIWLTLTLHRYGSQILRIKGLLSVEGLPAPVVIHSVQHVVHPPVHLDRWPSSDHRSRLVFIVRDLDAALVERSVRAFTRARPDVTTIAAYRPAGAGGTIGGRPIRRATAPRWLKG